MPRPCKLTFDLSTLRVMSRVTCDVGYVYANFNLPRPLCSRLRADVRDRQTSDTHHRLMPPPCGTGHNKQTPRAGSGVIRIDPLRFLAGCRKRRLNQALSVLSFSAGSFSMFAAVY